MLPGATRHGDSLECYRLGEVTVERYYCVSNEVRSVDRHVHEEYQFGISTTSKAAYRYLGATHQVGPGTLSLLHGGEPHETFELERIPEPIVYCITYVPPSLLRELAREIGGSAYDPFFRQPVVRDRRTVSLFHQFHSSLIDDSRLSQEITCRLAFSELIRRFSPPPNGAPPVRSARPAMRRVRDYLCDHWSRNASLAELAQVAQMSPSHTCSAFRRAFGIAPHQFQVQVRIDRAKRLLLQGMPVARVALECGFSHQSHFGRHFKRLVGIAPSGYGRPPALRNIVIASPSQGR